jgi:hypothetical protein
MLRERFGKIAKPMMQIVGKFFLDNFTSENW